MTPPLIVIGLDSAEATVLATGSDDDRFPTLAGLWRRGTHGRLVGLHEYLPDTAWAEIRTGTSGVRTGHYAALQFRSGERFPRALTAGELTPERFYWNVAAAAGLRVGAVDQPLAPPYPAGAADEVTGWGSHERPFGILSGDQPLGAIVERVGPHPIESCYRFNDGSPQSRLRLLTMIHEGIELRTRLLESAVAAAEWDLFTAVFAETHCAGHHFWPIPGAGPDRSDPATMEAVHRQVDAGLGRVLAAAPDEATVIVYSSHGMGPIDGGAFLTGDVLERLGMLSPNRGRRRASASVPDPLRRVIRRVIGGAVLQRVGFTLDRGFDDSATRAVPLPNPRLGAIRLALAGRDPQATLIAGSPEYAAVVAEIRSAFTELTLVSSGQSVVREVLVTDEVLGAQRHPNLPDILVRFRDDLGLIGDCASPRLGTIRHLRPIHRTGDHGTPGAVWITGPGITPGSELGDVRTIDIAPTVLAGLGLSVPEWIDGVPVAG